MPSFQNRLVAAQRGGNLTVADLARWFDRPHATVRTWVQDGIEPGGGPIDIKHTQELLGLLEALIKRKKGFPVPRLSPQKRIAHIRQIRAAVLP